jgi:formamidopyrimidine-DNA glycosylase
MPELPEIETARRLAERVARGRRIVEVWCARDPIVFERVPPSRVREALVGRRVTAARRHGKHFWLELDRRPWPSFHLGMAGGLHAPEAPSVQLASGGERGVPPDWPPRFTKLRFDFEDGGQLALTDARRLGRVRLRRDPAAEPPVSLLGFDALRELPAPARFGTLVRSRRAPIKALLLDQSFAAGVGNWIADEVLYQARIDPRRPALSLTAAEAHRVRAALRTVVATAVRLAAESGRFPRTWLFHFRWRRTAETGAGERIRRDVIGGRTAAWVPTRQH